MAIRNTPNGDEYDKDVALGVYAVNNGAKIINMSFGKLLLTAIGLEMLLLMLQKKTF